MHIENVAESIQKSISGNVFITFNPTLALETLKELISWANLNYRIEKEKEEKGKEKEEEKEEEEEKGGEEGTDGRKEVDMMMKNPYVPLSIEARFARYHFKKLRMNEKAYKKYEKNLAERMRRRRMRLVAELATHPMEVISPPPPSPSSTFFFPYRSGKRLWSLDFLVTSIGSS